MRNRHIAAAAVATAAVLATPTTAGATNPGENGRIVFGAEVDGISQLFTVGPHGGGRVQVTHLEGQSTHPDWSPDASHIVFGYEDGTPPAFCSIMRMRADGTAMKDLTGDRHGCDGQPAYTPSGRRIVYIHYNDVTDVEAVWKMDLRGGHRHRITKALGHGVTDPNVSPDGKWLSMIVYNGKDLRQAIYVAHTDGSHLTKIVGFHRDVAVKHDWSPNGRRIVFTDNADVFDQPANIFTVRRDGTGMRAVTHYKDPAKRAYAGSYSPDGRWIVYRVEDHEQYGLFRIHPDGTGRQTLIPLSDFRPRFIDWGSING